MSDPDVPREAVGAPWERAVTVARRVVAGRMEYVPAVIALYEVGCRLPDEGGATLRPILALYSDLTDIPIEETERARCSPEFLARSDEKLRQVMDEDQLRAVCRRILAERGPGASDSA